MIQKFEVVYTKIQYVEKVEDIALNVSLINGEHYVTITYNLYTFRFDECIQSCIMKQLHSFDKNQTKVILRIRLFGLLEVMDGKGTVSENVDRVLLMPVKEGGS